ncbi:MAG TPA: tetratricopeptide repeat protein [Ktedonobacteraceae bacterium]|jgi:tetratricopeptide (TPR) repeat protein
MSKKAKQSKQKKKVTTSPSQADKLFDLAGQQIFRGNYTEAVANYERLLNYLPQHAPLRADVLGQLGVAHGMLQNFPQSYEALTQALALDPNNADLWFNRSMASGYTMRSGQALWDIERAIELKPRDELTEKIDKGLKLRRKIAEESMKLRGPNFTLDQLIEQEDLFQQGLKLMQASNWAEAEQAFEASIAMGDCLSQPWGNLGICLMMQECYDESEAALKRALVFDPEYTIAKDNLVALAQSREMGPPLGVKLNEPFKHSKLKQSITFIRE